MFIIVKSIILRIRFKFTSKRKRTTTPIVVFLCSLGRIFLRAVKKKGAKLPGKRADDFSRLSVKRWRAITGTIIEHCWVQVAIERASG